LRRIFESRPLVGLGLISYGVYLWHWPITVWITEERLGTGGVALFAVRAVLTLAASLASYKLVEQPIRHRKLASWRPQARRVFVLATIAVLAVLLLIPTVAFPSVLKPPSVKPSAASGTVAATYETVPRCGKKLDTPAPVEAGVPPPAALADKHPRVEFVGNSVAVEVVPCLADLVEQGGGALETVAHSASPPCTLLPALRQQVENPATRPDAAIWFAFDWFEDESTCNHNWLDQVQGAIDIWKAAGVHIYLVPIIPNVVPSPKPDVYLVRGENVTVEAPAQKSDFEALAQADPDNITVIDPGKFLRDSKGAYQWRMPCLTKGEAGCGDDGTVAVRYVDGFHLCSNPIWDGTHCDPEFAGGDRRAAAAIAMQIEELEFKQTTPTART